jgi:tRNA threonylcarbamoyladenosine biosynthesis protein TsaE
MLTWLPETADTLAFARRMAREISRKPSGAAGLVFLLYGDLGAGKTTLVRGFVEALPGSEHAQVASPSFNICNAYPTQPLVAHCDLYRLGESNADAWLADHLEDVDAGADAEVVVFVEWAQYLKGGFTPAQSLHLHFDVRETGLSIDIRAQGEQARKYLSGLE